MSPILIAGLVLVCIVLFYFFDLFGVKKWADKTFGKKAANKFGDYHNDNSMRPAPKRISIFCKPGEILSTKLLKSDKVGFLLQYNCHDKTGKLTKSTEHIIPHRSDRPSISDSVQRVDPSNWGTNRISSDNPNYYSHKRDYYPDEYSRDRDFHY